MECGTLDKRSNTCLWECSCRASARPPSRETQISRNPSRMRTLQDCLCLVCGPCRISVLCPTLRPPRLVTLPFLHSVEILSLESSSLQPRAVPTYSKANSIIFTRLRPGCSYLGHLRGIIHFFRVANILQMIPKYAYDGVLVFHDFPTPLRASSTCSSMAIRTASIRRPEYQFDLHWPSISKTQYYIQNCAK